MWHTGAEEGAVFVANMGCFDQLASPDEVAGAVTAATAQTDVRQVRRGGHRRLASREAPSP
eukprot:8325905-Alexandrium_andersonii.AAC.1